MRTLVRGGTVVTASDQFRADVLIEDETIRAVGQSCDVAADRTIDAAGCYVLPGLVDSHTHLGTPADGVTGPDFDSGTAAAAAGGTTTVIDFAIQTDGSLIKGLRHWQQHAQRRAHIDYGFHLIIDDATPESLAEMQQAVDEGVTSFKVFMSGSLMMDDRHILKVLRRTTQTGGLVQVHAENGQVIDANIVDALANGETRPWYHAVTRPGSTEAEATSRAIHLAAWAERPIFFVHVSCAEALHELQQARVERRQPVYGETCVHYLLLTQERLDQPGLEGAKYVCSPPLRSQADQESLWSALRQRVLQNCTTDHCDHTFADGKDRAAEDFSVIPNGLASIENRLALLHEHGVRTGRISFSELVNITSTSPAQMFGLPQKGNIAPGCDADIVIFDPEASTTISAATHHMAVDYNPYEGWTCTGAARTVLSRGEVIYDADEVISTPGRGRYLARGMGAFGPGRITTI